MSLEILRILETKEEYDKYSGMIKDHLLTKEVGMLVRDLGKYYASHEEVDWTDFANWFKLIEHPSMKTEQVELYNILFDKLATEEIEELVANNILEVLIERDTAATVAAMAESIAEGTGKHSLDEIEDALSHGMEQIEGIIEEEDSKLITDDIEEIATYVDTSSGLKWRLDELNKSIGPIRLGDFITVAKRPDAGGTTMLASEATYMAPQLEEDQVVVWFNNEEAGKKVKFRTIQAALGKTKADILADPLTSKRDYDTIIGGANKILVFDKMHHVSDIERRLKQHNVGLIIIDQLWNLNGFENASGSEVTRQGLLFKRAREWAGDYAPVINVHQADGTAEGVKYINQGQMYGSKTAIQAHVDCLLCIGRSHEPGLERSRFISIPKNKLGSSEDEGLVNDKFEVTIKPEIARYE